MVQNNINSDIVQCEHCEKLSHWKHMFYFSKKYFCSAEHWRAWLRNRANKGGKK